MDYEVYAYLQLGQDARAKAVIDEMMTVPVSSETFLAAAYALAASPARYAVERGDWKGASALEVRPSPLPYITAISWFAKGLGAARSGDTAQAQAAIAQLVTLRDQLREKKDAYWSEQVDIQSRIVTAWTQLALGHQDEALKTMSDAADCRGQDRKTPGDAGTIDAGEGIVWRDAAPGGQADGGAGGVRGDDAQGAQPAERDDWCRECRRAAGDSAKAKQYFAAAAALASDASVNRPGDLAGARVPGECEIDGVTVSGVRTAILAMAWTMALVATSECADSLRHRSGRDSGRVGSDRDRNGTTEGRRNGQVRLA